MGVEPRYPQESATGLYRARRNARFSSAKAANRLILNGNDQRSTRALTPLSSASAPVMRASAMCSASRSMIPNDSTIDGGRAAQAVQPIPKAWRLSHADDARTWRMKTHRAWRVRRLLYLYRNGPVTPRKQRPSVEEAVAVLSEPAVSSRVGFRFSVSIRRTSGSDQGLTPASRS